MINFMPGSQARPLILTSANKDGKSIKRRKSRVKTARPYTSKPNVIARDQGFHTNYYINHDYR